MTLASGGAIDLTATTDVVVPANVGVTFGTGEKIEGDNTDLTIDAGGDINLTATTDINVPANVGMTFGDDGEKIEGDGTDLTIASSNQLNVNATAIAGTAIKDEDNMVSDSATHLATQQSIKKYVDDNIAATAYDDIGDPDASGSITMGVHTGTYTSSADGWGGIIIDNTAADLTAATTLLTLQYKDNNDPQGTFLKCIDDSAGTPDTHFSIGNSGNTTISGSIAIGSETTDSVTMNGQSKALQLAVWGDDVANEWISSLLRSSDTHSPTMIIGRARGTQDTPTAVADNDTIGQIGFMAHDGTDYGFGASIKAVVDGTPGDDDLPVELIFSTTKDGETTPTTALTLSPTQTATFASTVTATDVIIGDASNIGSASATDAIAISAAGILTLAKQPMAHVYQAANQIIPASTATLVCHDTEISDIQNEYDTTVKIGTADATEALKLHDADGGFEATDVGAWIWNTTDNTYAIVTAFVDSGELTLDTDIMVDTEGYKLYRSKFTCTEAGLYLCIAAIQFEAIDDTQPIASYVYKNGATMVTASAYSSKTSLALGITCVSIVSCAANDILQAYCKQWSGNKDTLEGVNTFFQVIKVA